MLLAKGLFGLESERLSDGFLVILGPDPILCPHQKMLISELDKGEFPSWVLVALFDLAQDRIDLFGGLRQLSVMEGGQLLHFPELCQRLRGVFALAATQFRATGDPSICFFACRLFLHVYYPSVNLWPPSL